MERRTLWTSAGLAALISAAALLGCKSEPSDPSADAQPASEKPAAPWTTEFNESSILIADEVSIEGPPGLIDHVAYKQVTEQKYAAKTTPEGFLQEVSAGEGNIEPIRIHLDNLAINAVRRGRWLERITDGPVRITARGDAYWKNLITGQEQRAATIELVGARAK
ncbi:MAG TPA: hypothetical protein VK843_22505 [Planctomycetota bacterium]|nr:hypothetical protein [Planctomycetota bacterium]